jgi:FMN reductase [NAD(P)H]
MSQGAESTQPRTRIEHERLTIAPEFVTDTIRVLTSHESIRSFDPTPLAAQVLDAILVSARSAPTSSNLQAYSVVVVQDGERRARLAHLVGDQGYVAQAPVMLIFCADVSRLHYVAERQGHHFAAETLEMFLTASIDATLALPDGVFAVAGLTLGYPAEGARRGTKPRLPSESVVHYEQYSSDELEQQVEAYDATMIANGLYAGRHVAAAEPNIANAAYGWAEHTARRTSKPETLAGPSTALREHLKDSIESRGFTIR